MLPPSNWSFNRCTMASYFGTSTLCAAHNCTNSRQSRRDLSFFKFPRDGYRSKQWIVNCRRPDFETKTTKFLYENCCVCGEHFEDNQFMNKTLKNRLIWTAVPTIFKDTSASEVQEAKMSEPLSVVPDSLQDCDDTVDGNGFKKRWRNLKVDEVDMKLRQSEDIEIKKQVSNFCMEISNNDVKYIVRGEGDESEGKSEGLRVIIKEEMEDQDSNSVALNKRKHCEVEEDLRTNSTDFNWKGNQDTEKGKRPKIFRTGEFEFVLVEGNLTPSALRYVLKEVKSNLVRCKKVSNINAMEKGRDTGSSYNGVDESENTGVMENFKTGEEVSAHHRVQGKPDFVIDKECTSRRTSAFNSGHFEFVHVDSSMASDAFEGKEENFGEHTTSTEVDPLAD